MGLSFKLVGETPSTIPAVDAGRMFFWFTALIFSSSVVLLFFDGAWRMGGGDLSIGSEYSLDSTERITRRGSLVIVAAFAAKNIRRVTVIMGSFPWSLNSSFSVTDPRLDIDPTDPVLVIFVLLVNAPLRLFLDVFPFVHGLFLLALEVSFPSLVVWVPPLKLHGIISPRWYE